MDHYHSITDTHGCAERGHSFPLTCHPMRVVPPWTSASNRWPEAPWDDTFTHGSGSQGAAYRCPTESGTRVCVPAAGGRQLPLIAMRTPHSHYLTAVCFSTTLTLDSVNTYSLSLSVCQTHISRLPPGAVAGQSLAIEGGVCRLGTASDWSGVKSSSISAAICQRDLYSKEFDVVSS